MPDEITPRFRSMLDRFVAFKAAKVATSPDGRSFGLASNESPNGPLPSVLEAINQAALQANRYPDFNCTALIEAISATFKVPAEHVAVGCGSVGVTKMLVEAVAEPGTEVLFAWRSFEVYPVLVGLTGATAVTVPLKDERHDLEAMADAVTERTRLILICNPNNPTGTVVGRAEFEAFLDRVPADCLVVLDEAYGEYVRDDDVADGLELYRDRPNLVVLRTFSKAYGLASLRAGFMVAHPVVAEAARKTALSFAVNGVVQAAAVASLAATDELLARVADTVKERERVRDTLLSCDWTVPSSEANFLWLPLGEPTAEFAAACEAQGVAVRAFPDEGVRVSIGSPDENDAFLAVARAFTTGRRA
ncbi:histidinol-phosphate transaminase [Actinomadura rubrisoli]|uniref:Aromatic amino acid aminotransferase n=1 Tax=Actinomadura rubrisoli TaxID=2530368 RepID=A0A4R5AZU4_9ACTN|nr:histidinol-phosphate transaminase [Actinomadura rubrisoli]TDD77769.1 aminotransferase class I/II-fold pyridoxal phosphate-dependent enzyme [Actinomadura rubrisoli]